MPLTSTWYFFSRNRTVSSADREDKIVWSRDCVPIGSTQSRDQRRDDISLVGSYLCPLTCLRLSSFVRLFRHQELLYTGVHKSAEDLISGWFLILQLGNTLEWERPKLQMNVHCGKMYLQTFEILGDWISVCSANCSFTPRLFIRVYNSFLNSKY